MVIREGCVYVAPPDYHLILDCPELATLITETIDTVSPVERTVQDTNGETYLLRIRPYKTPDNGLAELAVGRLEDWQITEGDWQIGIS